jgi:hypothetical protein
MAKATAVAHTAAPYGNVAFTALMILIPPGMIIAGWFLPPVWGWLVTMGLLTVFIVLIGHHIVGLWRGALIDQRNKISLSRLQLALWTILVVAGFLAVALYNIRTRQADPLKITVPPRLWALLGISSTSLVGSALIKQEKAKVTPEPNAAKRALAQAAPDLAPAQIVPQRTQLVMAANPGVPEPSDPALTQGVLTVNQTPDQSSWSDVFRAEEIGNAAHLDLGKIQMLYFTILIVFAYAVALGSLLAHASGKITDFPALGDGEVALLGISHAAYLTNKTVPRTPT